MYHSVYFGDKNTFDDWHLVPQSRPVIMPAQPKLIVDEIPGGNGSLDLTQSLTGVINYYDRSGSLDFLVLNDYGEWFERYSEILNYIQGKRMKMTLEDDPEYYYIGRYAVNEWKSQKDWSNITIDYRVEPFKYAWKEDKKVVEFTSNGTEVTFVDIEQMIIPEFVSTQNAYVTFNSRQHDVGANIPNKTIAIWPDEDGKTTLLINKKTSGTGTMTINYRRAKL